ncbi:MAG TPA: hypothetical protein VMP08_07005 [Anaerolineae bacterium]|nr:hypothetical protein [Anaerolineae bacterium]
MIIALLPDAATTEMLLNNLAEAEFDLQTVSVVMREAKHRAAIAEDVGPLKGIAADRLAEHLTRAGLTAQQAAEYAAAVQHGQVFIAIDVPESLSAVAREMLGDHDAKHIQGMSLHA